MNLGALRKLVDMAQRSVATAPIREQIELYEALGEILPTPEEREHAKHIAWLLSETERHQLDFTAKLFRGAGAPKHDGESKGGQS